MGLACWHQILIRIVGDVIAFFLFLFSFYLFILSLVIFVIVLDCEIVPLDIVLEGNWSDASSLGTSYSNVHPLLIQRFITISQASHINLNFSLEPNLIYMYVYVSTSSLPEQCDEGKFCINVSKSVDYNW